MKRPRSVAVFGILNLLLGSFFAFGAYHLWAHPEVDEGVARIIHETPAYETFLKLEVPLAVMASAALLAAGIGLLRLKSWARKLSVGYGICKTVLGLVSIVGNFLFLVRPLLQQAAETGADTSGMIGFAIGGCFSLIYPILLIIFMSRPKAVAAFQQPAPMLTSYAPA